ncbi:MAG: hypothetical protein JNJ63_02850 [Hyphomonadaceae bacterium]|nr:hypothetical protein [Hyphomonadaceae bacterium]
MDLATTPTPRMKWAALAVEIALGGVLGAVLTNAYLSNAAEVRWADGVALIIAMVCIIGSVRLFTESFNAAAVARRLGVEGEATSKEQRDQRVQALAGAAFGVAFFWPPLATLHGGPAPAISYVVIAAFLVLQVWSIWRGEQSTDEYARAHVRRLSWGAFLIGQTALLAYAAAERMGLVPPLTAWEILVLFTALSIIAPLISMRGKVHP